MTNKKFFAGMAVLLSVSLFVIGCPTEPEEKIVTVDNSAIIHYDVQATSPTGLIAALADTTVKSIAYHGVGSAEALTDVTEIPADKTVGFFSSVKAAGLEIKGVVFVEAGGSLTVASGNEATVTGGGVINVTPNGTLDVDDVDSLNDGEGPPVTVLGTNKVAIAGTLKFPAATAAAIDTALTYIKSGATLDVGTTAAAALKPSEAAGIALNGKKLVITANDSEDQTTLTVPAGLSLTTTDTLASLVGEAGETPALTVAQGGSAVLSAATFASTTVGDIVIDGTATFGAAAVPGGDVKVAGSLAVTGSLTVAAGAELAIAGAVNLTGTGSVVLTTATSGTTGGAKITGTGKLTAQDAEIVGGTGGWLAVLDSGTAEESVTIASTATAGQATITGSTDATTASLKGGAGATITQKSGTASNSLTLTTVTVDLSADGSFTLKGAGTNGATVVLASTAAIIKGAGTTGAVTTANITAVGSVAIANLTIGTSVVFTDDTSGNAFETIVGAGSDNSIEAKVDLTLDKTTTLTYS
jgi:hypothetical protein